MSFRGLLDNVCDIKRADAGTEDPMGGYSDTTHSVLYWNVPCRFESQPKKQEILAYGGANTFPDYYLYIEHRSGLKEGDRVFFNSREFEITLVEDWSERQKYMRLSIRELERSK
jgi:SPP1 family predicted phage head-tail adaptor